MTVSALAALVLVTGLAVWKRSALLDREAAAPSGTLLVALALGAAVFELVLLGIDSGLGRLQVEDKGSFGIAALADWVPPGFADDAGSALETWAQYDPRGGPGYREWGAWFVLIDVGLLVPCYLLLLRGLILRARARARLPEDVDERLLAIATLWPLAVVLVAELIEGGGQLWLIAWGKPWNGLDEDVAVVTALASLVKWIMLILALVLLVMLWCAPLSDAPQARPWERRMTANARTATRVRRRAWAPLRVPLALVSVFGVLLVLPVSDQVPDALRRWLDGGSGCTAGAGVVGAITFAWAIWLSARRITLFDFGQPRRAPAPAVVFGVAVFVAAVAVLKEWYRLFGLTAVLVAAAVLTLLAGAPLCRSDPEPDGSSRSVDQIGRPAAWDVDAAARIRHNARLLSSAVVALLGLGCVRAFVEPVFLIGPSVDGGVWLKHLVGLVVAAVLTVVAPLAVYGALRKRDERQPDERQPDERRPAAPAANERRWWLLVGAAIVTAVLARVEPIGVPRALGAFGVLCLAMVILTIAGAEIARAVERSIPMRAFRAITLTRTPAFALIAVWFALATLADTGGFHDVRVEPEKVDNRVPARNEPGRLDRLLDDWWAAAADCSPTSPTRPAERRAVPLVLLAASGGGIRAGYWTASVLEHLTNGLCGSPGSPAVLFAASGISGGSLGLMTFASRSGPIETGAKVYGSLAEDHLAPTLSWMLLVDAPRSFIGFDEADRAERLERSWEQANPQLKESFADLPALPLMLLNGGIVESGCRLSVASVETGAEPVDKAPYDCRSIKQYAGKTTFAAATADLADFLCEGQKLNRSTAALLSARFPFISPTGRLKQCGAPEGTKASVAHVVDGGYIDRTGGGALLDLWREIEPSVAERNRQADDACIVPVYVQLENSYQRLGRTPPPRRPPELTAPLAAFGKVGENQQWVIATRAQSEFSDPFRAERAGQSEYVFTGPRYFHLAPRRRPGVQAPLGWVLSGAARRDLDDQRERLASSPDWHELRRLMEGGRTCVHRTESLPLSDVLFDTGEAKLTRDAARRVRETADVIRSVAPPRAVVIEGHTDCRGSTAHNFDLSLRRALSVRRRLQRRLRALAPSLAVEPFGESRPKAPNIRHDGSDDPEGRAANRRVEVRLDSYSSTRSPPSGRRELRRLRRCTEPVNGESRP